MTDSKLKWGIALYLILMVAALIFLAKMVGKGGTDPVPSLPSGVVVEETPEPVPPVEPVPQDILCEKMDSFQTKEELWDWLRTQTTENVRPFDVITCLWGDSPEREVLYRWDPDSWDYLPRED